MSDSRPKDADGKPINPLDANLRSLDLKSIEPVGRGAFVLFNSWQTFSSLPLRIFRQQRVADYLQLYDRHPWRHSFFVQVRLEKLVPC